MDIHAAAAVIRQAVNPQRLLHTAQQLIAVPSPTRSAGEAADTLARILGEAGFAVERPVADWPDAPAVVTRLTSGAPGRTLQFDGHLDTVHLPFVPPRFDDGILYGSGCSDMKGGIAACVEALRALKETGLPAHGQVLLTAHDHHEGPWGDRRQIRALIREGYTGDAVLLPEYVADRLPVAGRGMVIFEARITRNGAPVHEVLRAPDTPDVVAIGAELVSRLAALNAQVQQVDHPHAGHDSVFVGRIAAGEIYNQAPVLCTVNGTRRWVTPGATDAVLAQLTALAEDVVAGRNVAIALDLEVQGEAFQIDEADPAVRAFQAAHAAISGHPLPLGAKPFVDDGNTYGPLAAIPAITHGPAATGAHTLDERVSLDELVRVAQVYALTAVAYCTPNHDASPEERTA